MAMQDDPSLTSAEDALAALREAMVRLSHRLEQNDAQSHAQLEQLRVENAELRGELTRLSKKYHELESASQRALTQVDKAIATVDAMDREISGNE